MGFVIRMGKILEAGDDGSATLRLEGSEPETHKVYKRMRRGVVITDGQIVPGQKKSRRSVPFERDLEVAVWVFTSAQAMSVYRFTSRTQYDAVLADITS